MWLRYERTTVPLDKVIEKVVGDNDNDDSLVGISPDILIMEVYKYIFDSA
jgi:hypothetical protein